MKTQVNFEVDNVEVQKYKDQRFTKCVIECFASGENAHTNPVDLEDLKATANTIYDIPIVYSYDRVTNDYRGHEMDEVPLGFVKEDRKNNPLTFVKKKDGRWFLRINGLIWTHYGQNFMEIFSKNNNKKSVSVELTSIDSGESNNRMDLKKWVYEAITILGETHTPAVQGANIALQFSADKEEYLKTMEEKKTIKIDNTKESAVDGKWVNPRLKLLNPILEASNKQALLKEAYLFVTDYDEPTLEDVSYPHHIIKGDKMVLHQRGVQAAFSRLAQQHLVKGEAKKHLLRHYKELGLSTENFEEFGLTAKQFEEFFAEEFRKEEEMGSEETKEVMEEKTEQCTEEEFVEIDESECAEEGEAVHEEKCECHGEEEYLEEESKEDSEEEKDESPEEDDEEEKEEEPEKKEDEPKTYSAEEYNTLVERCCKLEEENKAFLEKMADYEELKAFKEACLIKEEQEKEIKAMASVFASLQDKGIQITEEQKEELKQKRSEFSNIVAWSNYVKAYAFDNLAMDTDGVIKMQLPKLEKEQSSASIWDKLEKI